MDKLKALITSRKFWASFVGLAMIVIKAYAPAFPLTETQVADVVYVLIAYILGTALEDAGAAKAASALLLTHVSELASLATSTAPVSTNPAQPPADPDTNQQSTISNQQSGDQQ